MQGGMVLVLYSYSELHGLSDIYTSYSILCN